MSGVRLQDKSVLQRAAIGAFQEASETYLAGLFEDTLLWVIHTKKMC